MSKLITIKNECAEAVISTFGAEIQSLAINGKEYIWDGDPNFWTGRAPVLFPICGGLKDDKYVFNGSEYSLSKHGYARFSEFEPEFISEKTAVFLLKSDEKSKRQFPFDYELRIKYTLEGSSLAVEYSVKNLSQGDMYFSIGAHEAYACPEGIEQYSLHFEKKEHLTCNVLHGNLMTSEEKLLGDNIDVLPLKYDYFDVDALTFLKLKSKEITLKHDDGKRQIRVRFEGFDYVFVWTKPGAGYICIEPWCGVPDFEGTGYDITEKVGINRLSGGETFKRRHTITIEK